MATAKQNKPSPKASNAPKPTRRERPTTNRRPPKTASKPSSSRAKATSSIAASARPDDASAPHFRVGSKADAIVDLLRHKDGATVAEMTSATGWQPHSVRGFLAGALRKKLSLEVTSTKEANGERRYRLPS
jgi:outer membrane biosynthesis protein TonB